MKVTYLSIRNSFMELIKQTRKRSRHFKKTEISLGIHIKKISFSSSFAIYSHNYNMHNIKFPSLRDVIYHHAAKIEYIRTTRHVYEEDANTQNFYRLIHMSSG